MTKKFIIIDHSLCSLQGHHYECSISVAEAAIRQGYRVIIVANKLFTSEYYPHGVEVISAFEVDWFGNPTLRDKSYLEEVQNLIKNLSKKLLADEIFSKIQYRIKYLLLRLSTKPQWQLFREKVEGSTARLGNWLRKDLQLLQYIPLANTTWGMIKIIVGLLRFIFAAIVKIIKNIWHKLFDCQAEKFIETLPKILGKIKVSSEDQIFIHTLGIEQLQDLFFWLNSQDKLSFPRYHIMLRRDIEDSLVTQAKGIGLKSCLDGFYESRLWPDRIRFYTDTKELVERYDSISPVKFTQIPVPFRQEKLKIERQKKEPPKPIHIVYLGDARREKGYHLLPEIVAGLWHDYIHTNSVKFTIQSNLSIQGGERGILKARLELEQYPEGQVKLIKKTIDTDTYYQLLADADLMVFPYDIDSYRYRTSGVFTESLGAGKPVIVPANSWLATQVDSSRAVIYNSDREIVSAIVKAIAKLPALTEAAAEFSSIWREKHSPDALIDCVLSNSNTDAVNPLAKLEITDGSDVPKILYIAQGDAIVAKNIQGQIILSHLEYLIKCGYKIYSIFYPSAQKFRYYQFPTFVSELKAVIENYHLSEVWLLNYSNSLSLPEGFEQDKYLKKLNEQELSLERDFIEINSLEVSESLISLLQEQNLALVFIDSVSSWSLVNKLGLSKLPTICQVSDLYAYQYAMEQNRDVDEGEFEFECELLAKSKIIVCSRENQLAKIKDKIPQSNFYLLPPTSPLSREVRLASGNKISNFLWRSQNKQYQEIMNGACSAILGERARKVNQLENTRQVAILYPWGDILERKAGASKRVGLLIDYLKQKNHQIWLFTIGDKPESLDPQVRYTFYRQDFDDKLELVKKVYQSSYDTWIQWQKIDARQQEKEAPLELKTEEAELAVAQDWRLSMYYQFRFDRHFISWIEQIAGWADVILLEYPFWAKTVSQICQGKKVKLIITAHDAIYKQVKDNTPIQQILLAEEISALQTAGQVISVAEGDRKLWQKFGIDSIVIPNPVELKAPGAEEKEVLYTPKLTSLEIAKQYPWLEQNYCLFVGSNHFPNVEAVRQIRNLARQYNRQNFEPKCRFIVVGGCCEKTEEDNSFIALGKVESELLTILYGQANLVISPMLSGTGSSLKVMEAMGYGKVILGTGIAFRGYDVQSELNCIISDELDEYARIINQILSQPEKLETIGQNARILASNYDYQKLYSKYQELILATDLNRDILAGKRC